MSEQSPTEKATEILARELPDLEKLIDLHQSAQYIANLDNKDDDPPITPLQAETYSDEFLTALKKILRSPHSVEFHLVLTPAFIAIKESQE